MLLATSKLELNRFIIARLKIVVDRGDRIPILRRPQRSDGAGHGKLLAERDWLAPRQSIRFDRICAFARGRDT